MGGGNGLISGLGECHHLHPPLPRNARLTIYPAIAAFDHDITLWEGEKQERTVILPQARLRGMSDGSLTVSNLWRDHVSISLRFMTLHTLVQFVVDGRRSAVIVQRLCLRKTPILQVRQM